MNIDFLREHLLNRYPKLLFGTKLLHNLLYEGRQRFSAANGQESQIESLCEAGKRLEKNGGHFNLYEMCGVKVPTLKGACFQTKIQKQAVEVYGDLVFLDSTHGLSSFILLTSLPTLIDCYILHTI